MMGVMRFQHELSYDASPDQVWEMLADQSFREAVCAAQGVDSAEVDLTRTGTGFSLVIDQQLGTGDLPSFARAFAGDSLHLVQREEWPDSTGGTVKIEAPGKPAQISGTVTLRPEGSSTVEIVELEVRIKVPLIGSRIEHLLVDKIRASLDVEHDVAVSWLEGAHR